MAFIIKNKTREPKTLTLSEGNCITLYPVGSYDKSGKLDEARILDTEVLAADVVSFQRLNWITVEADKVIKPKAE